MTTDVLKPCPICGGRAILEDRSNFLGDPYWEPVCDAEDCVLSGCLRYPTQAEAIAVWNNREAAETAERPDASDYRNRAERAEAECLELRVEIARLTQLLEGRDSFIVRKGLLFELTKELTNTQVAAIGEQP
jgi:hypothetical protein